MPHGICGANGGWLPASSTDARIGLTVLHNAAEAFAYVVYLQGGECCNHRLQLASCIMQSRTDILCQAHNVVQLRDSLLGRLQMQQR